MRITTKRIEYKDTLMPSRVTQMEKNLFSSNLCFRTQYPPRKVNSLYFDSFDLISYQDSIEGGSNRIKKRLRWYGDLYSRTNATLEFKIKNGHQSWKKLWDKSFLINPKKNSWNNFFKRNIVEYPFETNLRNSLPSSIVSYDRKYFVSFDNKVRVTIDQNLSFFEQRISKKTQPNLE